VGTRGADPAGSGVKAAGPATAAAIGDAVTVLRRGEIVAYPTETFYGLAVDALSADALDRLRACKGRAADKAISVLVCGAAMIERLCADVPAPARDLMARHWPGPLTLALPARPGLPAAVVADGFVAVRESPHPIARALCVAFGGPITATSANPAGAAAAISPAQVRAAFPDLAVIDGGDAPGGAPSTIARVRSDGRVEILRQGAIQLG
jgi:L-threonylcarbamoyladenylate synthase